ncbi:hypothetical protein V496_08591 [Pseudogymnoascus sp. VKM F-4515 (FW-2607)]|nr:hypothetical protein V496_08591 [Pseudogymnoascus sp. VKM F-4515 (FW-2607)]
MVDPLSVTASIIAVLQLTATLVSHVNDAKDAPSDQARFAKEAQSLSDLLTKLICRVNEGRDKSEGWYKEVEALGEPDGPLGQYGAALEKLRRKIKSREGLAKIGNVLLWKFIKEDVASILLQIERIKSLIQIALQMDHLKLSLAIKDCLAELHSSNEELRSGVNAVITSIPAMQDGIDKIQLGQDREQNGRLLKWISSTDFPSQLSDIISTRQEGTGQWFLESTEFNNWLSKGEKTLFCPGIPGAGKTMVSAIAIDHLYKTIHDHSIGVAYVFCNYKVQKEQNTLSLLSAILKQLVQAQPAGAGAANALYELHSARGTRASADEILNTLKLTLKHFSTAYIVVDALDECSDEYNTPLRLLEKLRDLQNTMGIRLMVTSRLIPDIVGEFRSAPKLEVRASPQDVTKFVKGQIPRLNKCVQRDNELQLEIEEQLVKAVDGMFLLARLHVDSLLDKTTKSKVRSTLKRLSSGEEALDKAYDDAIKRIEAQQEGCSELAKRVLTWISYAERPLTIEELRHALSVNPGDTDLDADNFEDMEDIVSFCAGLVTVDDKSNIVRLIHYTTQEYFLRIRQGWNPTAQQDITITCLTYLSFDPFKTAISNDNTEIFETYVFFEYACQHWAHHAMPVQEQVLDLARTFLKDMNLVANIAYSRINATGVHITAKLGLKYLLEMILTELDEAGRAEVKDDKGRTPLSWAAQHGQVATVKLLVERNDVNADSRDNKGRTPLLQAVQYGHAAIVKLLAECNDVDADSKDNFGRTPLSWAVQYGHAAIVELLTERDDVDADSKNNRGRTPLSWAAGQGQEAVVKLLVERDDVDANSKNNNGRTPLSWAAGQRREAVVKLLVASSDVNADLRDNDGRTPLSWAVRYCEKETIALLIERDDVNADSKDINGRTPLSWAGERSEKETVALLVERDDVNANSKDNDGRTPLSYAASAFGTERTVMLLIEREDVEVNSKDNKGLTPLMWAAKHGHKKNIETFLEKENVDVNLRDNVGHTALWWADQSGDKEATEMLKSKIPPIEQDEYDVYAYPSNQTSL